MATFAELSVFNKMLLDKMQRMEEEHKKEISKLQDTYYSLVKLADDEEYYCCEFCNKWFDADWDHDNGCDGILDHNNGQFCCPECEEQGIGHLKKCVDCDDVINLDRGHKCFPKKTPWGEVKYGSDVVCKRCNRIHLYPAVEGSVFRNYDEVVGKMQSLVGTMTVAYKAAGLPDRIFKPSWMDTYYK